MRKSRYVILINMALLICACSLNGNGWTLLPDNRQIIVFNDVGSPSRIFENVTVSSTRHLTTNVESNMSVVASPVEITSNYRYYDQDSGYFLYMLAAYSRLTFSYSRSTTTKIYYRENNDSSIFIKSESTVKDEDFICTSHSDDFHTIVEFKIFDEGEDGVVGSDDDTIETVSEDYFKNTFPDIYDQYHQNSQSVFSSLDDFYDRSNEFDYYDPEITNDYYYYSQSLIAL